jgi:hypothetical protein
LGVLGDDFVKFLDACIDISSHNRIFCLGVCGCLLVLTAEAAFRGLVLWQAGTASWAICILYAAQYGTGRLAPLELRLQGQYLILVSLVFGKHLGKIRQRTFYNLDFGSKTPSLGLKTVNSMGATRTISLPDRADFGINLLECLLKFGPPCCDIYLGSQVSRRKSFVDCLGGSLTAISLRSCDIQVRLEFGNLFLMVSEDITQNVAGLNSFERIRIIIEIEEAAIQCLLIQVAVPHEIAHAKTDQFAILSLLPSAHLWRDSSREVEHEIGQDLYLRIRENDALGDARRYQYVPWLIAGLPTGMDIVCSQVPLKR